ncbi:MAG TPA: Xaa-Pro peptidase family protein [Ktedonobacterales bacterium]|nr:Xaa-Pro peptidase family protein [Ktedonobacterales bacterium]
MDQERLQQAIRNAEIDGWLFFDFRKSNSLAYRVLGLSLDGFYTRRWFYFVPAQGEPTAIISAVEPHVLRELPGRRLVFRSWEELHRLLGETMQGARRVAMEYSPMNAIPTMAKVDGGALELIRSLGKEIVSSANLVQQFVAILSQVQVEMHREAGRRLIEVKDALLHSIAEQMRAGKQLTEYSVQQDFRARIQAAGVETDSAPIVAVNAHASDPHYGPSQNNSAPLREGDLLLLDFWGFLPQPGAIFADYTWTAFLGARVPEQQQNVFDVVRRGRDHGIAFLREHIEQGKPVQGWEVDQAVRDVITNAGYGEYFVHRTGHSITTVEHGDGANLDNLETHDERLILPNTCCSIEPGIYLPEFGIRSEVDVLVHERSIEVTGVPIQEELIALLA